jgi:hypothetical protein
MNANHRCNRPAIFLQIAFAYSNAKDIGPSVSCSVGLSIPASLHPFGARPWLQKREQVMISRRDMLSASATGALVWMRERPSAPGPSATPTSRRKARPTRKATRQASAIPDLTVGSRATANRCHRSDAGDATHHVRRHRATAGQENLASRNLSGKAHTHNNNTGGTDGDTAHPKIDEASQRAMHNPGGSVLLGPSRAGGVWS